MKGRYYRNNSPLDQVTPSLSSYGWKSISSARPLVRIGLIRKIGDGKSISVWNDPWVPDLVPRPAIGLGPNIYPDLTLDQFIDASSGRWREILLRQFFAPSDVVLILGLRLPRSPRADSWSWHYTKTGKYTVKSGYHIEETAYMDNQVRFGPNFTDLQDYVWKLDCPPKIRHFLWQAISGCMAVKSSLIQRGIQCDVQCTRCGFHTETINHTLFKCPLATQVWALSNIPSPVDVFPGESVWSNLDYLFRKIPKEESNRCYPWILWHIWKSRNEFCFSGINKDPRDIIREAESDTSLWFTVKADSGLEVSKKRDSSHVLWPEVSYPLIGDQSFSGNRCFVDGSWKETDSFSGGGLIVFSDSSRASSVASCGFQRSLSAVHCEVEAVIWAMEWCLSLHLTEVEMGTDCTEVCKIFGLPLEWPAFSSYQDEFEDLKTHFRSFKLSVIPRGLNSFADRLANQARIVYSNRNLVND